jgi:imidazolonepropionase-like amidohydrolase
MDGYVAPKSATAITIDLKDKVVMPGLIDFHVHIEQEFNRKTRLNKYILNEADVALNSVGFAKTTLLNGFTTVRDLGGSGVNISVRNAIN